MILYVHVFGHEANQMPLLLRIDKKAGQQIKNVYFQNTFIYFVLVLQKIIFYHGKSKSSIEK